MTKSFPINTKVQTTKEYFNEYGRMITGITMFSFKNPEINTNLIVIKCLEQKGENIIPEYNINDSMIIMKSSELEVVEDYVNEHQCKKK